MPSRRPCEQNARPLPEWTSGRSPVGPGERRMAWRCNSSYTHTSFSGKCRIDPAASLQERGPSRDASCKRSVSTGPEWSGAESSEATSCVQAAAGPNGPRCRGPGKNRRPTPLARRLAKRAGCGGVHVTGSGQFPRMAVARTGPTPKVSTICSRARGGVDPLRWDEL